MAAEAARKLRRRICRFPLTSRHVRAPNILIHEAGGVAYAIDIYRSRDAATVTVNSLLPFSLLPVECKKFIAAVDGGRLSSDDT